jgi:type II secretory pathway pseudopilin PulG
MAAIVVPQFQGHVSEAKASSSQESLRTMRSQIGLYKMHHDGYPPGYVNGAGAPIGVVPTQLIGTTATTGQASTSTVPAGSFIHGPYLKSIPENPYNGFWDIIYCAEATAFAAAANDSSGWLYKKETGEIRLNTTGTDDDGVAYADY